VLVARPEELPVTEAGEAAHALRHRLGVRLALVVANGVLPERFDERGRAAVAAVAARAAGDGLGPAGRAAVAAGLARVERRAVQEAEVARLQELTGAAPVELPLVEAPLFGPRELAVLARTLEPACR
jgi:anion-transporting  ArsA/GET3 family ATPase